MQEIETIWPVQGTNTFRKRVPFLFPSPFVTLPSLSNMEACVKD